MAEVLIVGFGARAKKREHYKVNKEKANAYRKKWRQEHKEQDAEIGKRWRERHPDKYRQLWQRNNRLRRERVLRKISEELKCVRCGCDKFDLLEINHKNGGGLKEVGRKNQVFMQKILDGERPTDDLEILCKMCNILHYIEMKFGPQPYTLTWGANGE